MRQPPRPGSAQRSIWEGATICLGWCGLSVPALADQPFARICMANNFASISDLNVRVDRTAPVALSSVFKVLSGPKATYKVSFVNADPSALIPQSGRPEPQIPFRLESSCQAIMDRLERGAEKCRART